MYLQIQAGLKPEGKNPFVQTPSEEKNPVLQTPKKIKEMKKSSIIKEMKKSPNAPMGYRTGYMIFLRMECDRLKKIHGESSAGQFRDMAIDAWRHLSKNDREVDFLKAFVHNSVLLLCALKSVFIQSFHQWIFHPAHYFLLDEHSINLFRND